MKKILSIMLAAALAMPMFAEKQSIEERGNADYSSWLPQEGEFSIGFSVDPFANFLGKMFSTGANPGNYTHKRVAFLQPFTDISHLAYQREV